MLLQGYVCGIHHLHPKRCISYCLRFLLNYFCMKRIKEYSTHFKLIHLVGYIWFLEIH